MPYDGAMGVPPLTDEEVESLRDTLATWVDLLDTDRGSSMGTFADDLPAAVRDWIGR